MSESESIATYYVDEAGDGVLFGRKGRTRLDDPDARKFFILGMVRCSDDQAAADSLGNLRTLLRKNPFLSSIHSFQPVAKKTDRFFHAKDDHSDIRLKVFEHIMTLDFKFFAVVKDMRKVLTYVRSRNEMDSNYQYKPNDLYDLTVRMLFKNRLHKEDHYRVTFAPRGKSDRTQALTNQLIAARTAFLKQYQGKENARLEICPAYPWEQPCLQIADYCLWALQRCYESGESRFLEAIWEKVSLIHDVDDPEGKGYGTYLTRRNTCPKSEKIKSRWI